MAEFSTSPNASAAQNDPEVDQILPAPPAPQHVTVGERRLPGNPSPSAGPRQTIDNPLLTFDDTVTRSSTAKTELEEYVDNFARQSNLEDRYELLLFGTRLARDKHEAMSRYHDELTDPERLLLQNEDAKQTGFWQQSRFFRATIITASFGGMIQGWTQSIINGTINGMPQEFGLCISRDGCDGHTSDLWTFGMLSSIPLFAAALFGIIFADPLQEYYLGRRGSILVSCCITVASTIGASATQTVAQLAVCRAINGIALGAKASIVPIYSAELSPQHIRGAILANWQLADAGGIFFGFMANLIIVSYVSNTFRSWRILTNTALIPTIPLLIMIYLMPESPRYLMKHGKYRKALEAFMMIQTSPLLASRDLMYAHAQLDFESRLLNGNAGESGNLGARIAGTTSRISVPPAQSTGVRVPRNTPSVNGARPRNSHQQSTPGEGSSCQTDIELSSIAGRSSAAPGKDVEAGTPQVGPNENPYFYHVGVIGYFKRLQELVTNKRCQRALLSASIAMISQQMTGVNTIAFLGTTVWENSLGSSTNPKVTATIGLLFGAANYLGGLPAYWLSDNIGRSILMIIGLPNTAWSMLIFAFLFKLPEESPARVPLVSIWAIIFTLFYAPTSGTSPYSIAAEVFPLVSREVGMAVSVGINLGGAGILVLVFPMLMHWIGTTGALSIFAGLNVVAFVLVYLFVPETRRRTLEELQFTFDLKTEWHVEYRMGHVRKHFVKNFWKYLTGKKVRPPIPFYRWARITHGQEPDEERVCSDEIEGG